MFYLVVRSAFFQPGLAIMWLKYSAIHNREHRNQINTSRMLKSQHGRPRCKLPLKDREGELKDIRILSHRILLSILAQFQAKDLRDECVSMQNVLVQTEQSSVCQCHTVTAEELVLSRKISIN